MAVIGKIRKHSALLVIIIGVALAAFILGDFLKPGRGGSKKLLNIGVVDGQDIPGTEFNRKVDESLELRRQSMEQNITPQEAFSIRQGVWQEMVSKIIMEEQYDHLGVMVSVEELDDQIRGNDPHSYIVQNFTDPQTGQFNPQSVTQFLQNFSQVEASVQERYFMLERMIKEDRLRTKYNNLISKGYYIPDAFAEIDYEMKNKKAICHLVAPRYNTIPDTAVTVTESDYQKYYDEHKNEFEQEAMVDVDYVVFEITPSLEDRKNIDDDMNNIYEDFQTVENVQNFVNAVSDNRYDSSWVKEGVLPVSIDSVVFNSSIGTIYGPYIEEETYRIIKVMDIQMRPDSMQASHMLIAFEGSRSASQVARTKDEAKALADSLLEVTSRNSEQFTDLAVQFSEDPSVQNNDGDLGWFPDGMMVYPFNQAVLEGNEGDIVVVETDFGFHVIKVGEKTELLRKARVAMIDRAIEASSVTFQDTYLKASDFATQNNTLDKFEQAVVDQGLNKRSADKIDKMSNNIPGVEYPRQIVYWSFNDKTHIGDISPVLDMGNSYVVAVLKNRFEKGIAPLEEIKETIEPLVLREKKADLLVNQLNEAIASGDNMAIMAVKFDATVDTVKTLTFASFNIPQYGPEKDVIGKIFTMQPGEMSEPIRGEQAVYVVVLDEFVGPDVREDYSQQKNFLTNSMNSRAGREAYNALEKNANIEDNRIYYY